MIGKELLVRKCKENVITVLLIINGKITLENVLNINHKLLKYEL